MCDLGCGASVREAEEAEHKEQEAEEQKEYKKQEHQPCRLDQESTETIG